MSVLVKGRNEPNVRLLFYFLKKIELLMGTDRFNKILLY